MFCKKFLISFFLSLLLLVGHALHAEKRAILNGWYEWGPYQYVEKGPDGIAKLTGLDVELSRAIAAEARFPMHYDAIHWDQHRQDLIEGKRDIACGVTKSEKMSPHFYYSEPYRQEFTGFFTHKKNPKRFKFSGVDDFISGIKSHDFRLGVVKGFVYADDKINAFITDPDHQKYIINMTSTKQSLEKLLAGEIDGFLAERLSGATMVWRDGQTSNIIERQLGSDTPIHIAFSRKTTTLAEVAAFNAAIETIKKSGKYDMLFSQYLHPLILLQTLDSDWFFIIEIIGTIAFAISGLILAYQDRATLFGALIYALLPSTGGGMLRDIVVGRDTLGVVLTPVYLLVVIATVLIGFFCLKIFARRTDHKKAAIQSILNPILVLTDAIGLASFVVIGVMVAMLLKIAPLWLWGPFLAFLTGAGGGIMRDLIRKSGRIASLHGEIYPEIAILWGGILSGYLILDAHTVNPDHIFYAVICTVLGATLTRVLVYYYKVPNIRFS